MGCRQCRQSDAHNPKAMGRPNGDYLPVAKSEEEAGAVVCSALPEGPDTLRDGGGGAAASESHFALHRVREEVKAMPRAAAAMAHHVWPLPRFRPPRGSADSPRPPLGGPPPLATHVRRGISHRGCGCAGVCAALFMLQLLLVTAGVLLWSPSTFGPASLAAPSEAAACDEGLRNSTAEWSTEQQEVRCRTFGRGCSGDGGVRRDAGIGLKTLIRIEEALLLVAVCVPLLACALGRYVESGVIKALEAFERSVLHGATIEVGALTAQVCVGIVAAEGLVIRNPEGFSSPYLLTVGKLYADLDMGRTICSCFRRVVIDRLDLTDVDVIIERKGGSTNLHELQEALGAPEFEYTGLVDKNDKEKGFALVEKSSRGRELMVVIHEVTLTDVGTRHQSAALGGLGMRVDLCDMHYDDLAKELGCRPARIVAKLLMGSFVKSVISSVAGKAVGDRWL